MKRLLAGVLFVAVAFLVAGPASAQVEKGRFYAGPTAGVALPFGDLADGTGIGITVGGTGDYLVTPMIAVGPDLFFNFMGGEEFQGVELDGFTLTQVGGHGRYFFSPGNTTVPFISGGLAYYDAAGGGDIGLNAGGGVLMNAGRTMKLNISGTVHFIMSDGSTGTYLNGTVGLLFPFGG